jgi:hypothetical protein
MCLENAPFATSQAVAVWNAVSTCWSSEVYMPVLSYRFWKLTLQVRRDLTSIFADLTPPSLAHQSVQNMAGNEPTSN